MHIPVDREILLVVIYPAEMQTHATKDRQGMFRAVLFVIVRKRKRKRGRGGKG